MSRSPIDWPRLLLGMALAASLTAATAASRHRAAAPPAATGADDDDNASAALSACERRAQGRLRTWDRLGDAAVSATRGIGHILGASEESVAHVLRFGHSLSESVQRRLDCHEQHQAEVATAHAIAGGVGTTSRWTSETRRHVSGSSTVEARERTGAGDCLTVTDIIIVDGVETRAPKRMCRRPPSNRYMRV